MSYTLTREFFDYITEGQTVTRWDALEYCRKHIPAVTMNDMHHKGHRFAEHLTLDDLHEACLLAMHWVSHEYFGPDDD